MNSGSVSTVVRGVRAPVRLRVAQGPLSVLLASLDVELSLMEAINCSAGATVRLEEGVDVDAGWIAVSRSEDARDRRICVRKRARTGRILLPAVRLGLTRCGAHPCVHRILGPRLLIELPEDAA